MDGIFQPVWPVGDKGPGADVGNAGRQRINITIGAIGECHLTGKPVFGNMTFGSHQVAIDGRYQLGMVGA